MLDPRSNRSGLLRALVGALLVLVAGACSKAPSVRMPITVFAAASLTVPFEAMGKAFEFQDERYWVRFSFDGSQHLALQIQEGARVDVFASADLPNLQKVVNAGLTSSAPRTFATNGLAIAVGSGNPKGIATLADLARADLRVALCGPEVPIGRYARAALAKAGVTVQSVSDEANVKALVAKVRLGEIDAAIVYRTDVVGAGLEAVAVAKEHDVVAEYPLAVLKGGVQQAGGEAFAAFVLGERGRAILKEHGFGVP